MPVATLVVTRDVTADTGAAPALVFVPLTDETRVEVTPTSEAVGVSVVSGMSVPLPVVTKSMREVETEVGFVSSILGAASVKGRRRVSRVRGEKCIVGVVGGELVGEERRIEVVMESLVDAVKRTESEYELEEWLWLRWRTKEQGYVRSFLISSAKPDGEGTVTPRLKGQQHRL